MKITIEIDTTDGAGIPLHDRRILRAIANAGDTTALAGSSEASTKEALDVANLTSSSFPMSGEAPGGPDYGTPGEADFNKEAYEAAAQQPPAEDEGEDEGEDTSDLPRHPDGRIVGRAPEGKKRRTAAQIAEDKAWEAAQKAQQPAELGEGEPDDDEPEPEEAEPPYSDGGIIPPGPTQVQNTTGAPEQVVQPPQGEQPPPAPQAPAPAPSSSPFNF